MSLSLCMLVKNESARIERCIDSVKTGVDEFFITDTGSSDGTPELLMQKYGISVKHGQLETSRCLCKQDLRNKNFDAVKTDWILILDADEMVVGNLPDALATLKEATKINDGGFARWHNELPGQSAFDDYKLFLFKNNFRARGLIHDNVQIDIREKNGRAVWLDHFWVRHLPDPSGMKEKRDLYMRRLQCAIAMEPEWLRYYWFLGYMNFLTDDLDVAERHLQKCGLSDSHIFPVERLNSLMVLAEIYARRNERTALNQILRFALERWNEAQQDFEVRVNPGLKAWFETSVDSLHSGNLTEIRARRFGS